MQRKPFFLGLTLAGLALRILFLLLEPSARLVGDEHTWTAWGAEIASPAVAFSPAATRLIFYPPAYPYFIAASSSLFGSLAAVKWCQLFASVLLIPAVGRVGAAALGVRAGAAAAAIAAFYPDLVWFSVHFWSETLFMTLLWWAFERLIAADQDGDRAAALFAGALWGLAILTRRDRALLRAVRCKLARPRPEPAWRPRARRCVLPRSGVHRAAMDRPQPRRLRRLRAGLDGRRPEPVAG